MSQASGEDVKQEMTGPYSLRMRLKEETAAVHQVLEATDLVDRLLSDPSRNYGLYLQALEYFLRQVGEHLNQEFRGDAWVQRFENMLGRIRSDLTILNLSPLEPSQLSLQSLPPASPAARLLGIRYVIEGSQMGNRIILKRIKAASDERAGLACQYLTGTDDGNIQWKNLCGELSEEKKFSPNFEFMVIATAVVQFENLKKIFQFVAEKATPDARRL